MRSEISKDNTVWTTPQSWSIIQRTRKICGTWLVEKYKGWGTWPHPLSHIDNFSQTGIHNKKTNKYVCASWL